MKDFSCVFYNNKKCRKLMSFCISHFNFRHFLPFYFIIFMNYYFIAYACSAVLPSPEFVLSILTFEFRVTTGRKAYKSGD